jgi:hypothetical protein
MSDTQRFWLIVAVAAGLPSILPDTHSWLVYVGRPAVALMALMALAPWRGDD